MHERFCCKSPHGTLYLSCLSTDRDNAIIQVVRGRAEREKPTVVADAWKMMEGEGWTVVKVRIEEMSQNTTEVD